MLCGIQFQKRLSQGLRSAATGGGEIGKVLVHITESQQTAAFVVEQDMMHEELDGFPKTTAQQFAVAAFHAGNFPPGAVR